MAEGRGYARGLIPHVQSLERRAQRQRRPQRQQVESEVSVRVMQKVAFI